MMTRVRYVVALLRRKVVIGALLVGAVLGIFLVGLARFVNAERPVHYHANVSVYIHGMKQDFKSPQYYQEISACDAHESPLGRVHLHDQNPNLVHVHDGVVTWADLFTNLGWSLNNSMLYDGRTAYMNGQDGALSFVLNGQPTRSIANEIIGDRDRLLISFGTDDKATLERRAQQIPNDAQRADETSDPAACQGPERQHIWTRLRQALWF